MAPVPGYEITSKLYGSDQSVVHRARRASDGRRVILKTLHDEYPHPARVARFVREYEIARRLTGTGVIEALALESHGHAKAIVMEDIGAESLDKLLAARPLPIEELLRIAARLAGILGRVHAAGVTHKDINPANAVYVAATGDVRLIDFGISTTLPREGPEIAEGTPAYMSPEQTGRMNRGTDYRTDFYALGATLYHLAAGRLPFPTVDAMELFHCHLARDPTPLHEVDPAIPPSLSAIVSRLMAKTAEDRYQSAEGVRADFEACLEGIARGATGAFELGRDDASDRFQIAEKLYGREREAAALVAAFDRASEGRLELCTVPGYSGIGKSALIHELHRPIVARRGYFTTGKFDQFNRHIPYTALLEAFRHLVRQILTEGEDEIAAFRRAFLDAVGPNARVVLDVIPELGLIVGEQPDVLALPPLEAQNRFNLVFRSFVRALCTPQHPLVLVLDDLQWADLASLKMLELVATDPDIRHALIIGAYRDNEVGAAHPLALGLKAIAASGGKVSPVALGPLGLADVTCLVADAAHTSQEEARPLAELCLAKTGGNPLFLRQFLSTLHGEGLLTFDRGRRAFRFDLDEIRSVEITDNVADLMTATIRKLPEAAQAALRLAACVGNAFELGTLALLRGRSRTGTAGDLWPALAEGLIVPADAGYKFVADADDCDVSYRFVHDRVQQAAYALIPEAELGAIHLDIGRRLHAHAEGEEREARLFEIVNHLNLARDRITSEDEREELARLDLAAGQKAKASAAYEPALRYFQAGLALLGDGAWDRRYDLTLRLTTGAAEAAQLSGDLETLDRLVDEVLARGRTLLDRVPAHEVRIQAYLERARFRDGLEAGLAVLDELGVDAVTPPTEARNRAMIARIKAVVAAYSTEELAARPAMTDPHKLAAMRIFTLIGSAIYASAKELVPLIVSEMVVMSAEHGVAPESAYGYGTCAFALCGVLDDVPAGYRFGQLALRLLDRPDAGRLRAKVVFLIHSFVNHWVQPAKDTLSAFLDGWRAGLDTGDLEYASHCAQQQSGFAFFAGRPLEEVDREADAFAQALVRLGVNRHRILLTQQAFRNLMGRSADPLRLEGDAFDEARIPEVVAAGDRKAGTMLHAYKLVLAYLFHAPRAALAEADLFEPMASYVASTLFIPVTYGFTALAALAAYPDAGPDERPALLARADAILPKMRTWAQHGPANHAHRLALIEAERARVLGDEGRARCEYDRAVRLARENGYLDDEALAGELAGRFYLSIGSDRVAAIYLKDARYAYLLWGAAAKVADLEGRHPEVFAHEPAASAAATKRTTTTTGDRTTGKKPGDALDLQAIMKATQAISGEVVLEDLLRKLMTTVLESAGAQRGVLLLQGDSPRAVASDRTGNDGASVVHLAPAGDQAVFSEAIARYVERTRETVVLGDAAQKGPFLSDPYVASRGSRSILCLPILKQKKLLGVLYLENDLAADAFTPERCEVLEMLAAQTAISIENARLYDTLENRVRERTHELSHALDRLKETQQQLLVQEKLASLGMLTSGIAHEINNPLNFVNNFAELSVELADELLEEVKHLGAPAGSASAVEGAVHDLRQNALKIREHGKRAESIVGAMLRHSRAGGGEARETDLNALVREYAQLAWQGQRGHPDGPGRFEAALEGDIAPIAIVSQDIGRVLMNLVTNALHATSAKRKAAGNGFVPTVRVATRGLGDRVEVRVRDNGTGIPEAIRDKVYNPFFTTKPAGEGTGLGLSISYDIVVQGHGGTLTFETEEGQYTEFVVTLPRRAAAGAR